MCKLGVLASWLKVVLLCDVYAVYCPAGHLPQVEDLGCGQQETTASSRNSRTSS